MQRVSDDRLHRDAKWILSLGPTCRSIMHPLCDYILDLHDAREEIWQLKLRTSQTETKLHILQLMHEDRCNYPDMPLLPPGFVAEEIKRILEGINDANP